MTQPLYQYKLVGDDRVHFTKHKVYPGQVLFGKRIRWVRAIGAACKRTKPAPKPALPVTPGPARAAMAKAKRLVD